MGYKSPHSYSIYVSHASLSSPLDSTTYYFGHQQGGLNTDANTRNVGIPKRGRICSAIIKILSGTATGTNEDISMYVRLNNTTDYLIATVGAATALRTFKNTDMNVPILDTDFIEIKIVTPIWVTNPQGWCSQGTILIECE